MSLRRLTLTLALLAVFGKSQLGYDATEIEVDESKHDIEFFNFVTRPDIDAPTWNITVYDESAVAPGLWFVAPYGVVEQTHNDKGYVAPHIYDGNGMLVWSGIKTFGGYDVFAFQVSDIGGEAMLTTLQPHEERGVLMNNQYEIYAEVYIGTYKVTTNMHEFQVVDNGKRALYLTREKENSFDTAQRVNYKDGRCDINWNGIEERDIETGEVTFTWSSKDHIALDESTMYRDDPIELCRPSSSTSDYIHLNSVEKLADGDYLTSGRRSDAIYKISHTDGSILWRLGGKKNDFDLDGHFSGQHDVRCLSENSTHLMLSIMDNAKGPGWPSTTNPNSRGLILSVNTQDMTAKAIKKFDHPYKGYADGRGSFQTLTNGNAFICWRDNTLCSEHTPEDKVVKVGELQSGLKTYRGWKSEWIGRPKNPPDIHSQVVDSDDGLTTVVHVSWNGDTEVAFWDLYEADAEGKTEFVLRTLRTGFETAISSLGYKQHVVVQGYANTGEMLGKSKVFETIKDDITDPKLLEELQWLQDHPEASSYPSPFWTDGIKGLLGNPLFTFFAGITVCIVAGLWVWGARAGWRNFTRKRMEVKYSALGDSEEDRAADVFYDKDSQELDELEHDDIEIPDHARDDND